MSDLSATQVYFETREMCHRDVYKHLVVLRKSLLELKSASKKALLDNTLFWQKEIERTREEKDQEWLEKIILAETENKQLRRRIQNLTKIDGSKNVNDNQLWEAENQIDKLSRQLDEKLIHINKLQIALAEQSKKMFELEKSCVLLYCQYKRLQHRENSKIRKVESKSEIDKVKLHPYN